jgi:CRP/FNR family cyclic AMP-dependent transcriptional regulator
MDQKVALLSNVPLLSGLTSKDLEEVGRLADEVDVREGKVLTTEGESGEEFFVILDGTVAVSRGGRHVRDLGPGDFFGEIALLGNVPRTATVTASSPARLLVLAHREFYSLLSNHPQIQGKILRGVASWVASLTPDRAC